MFVSVSTLPTFTISFPFNILLSELFPTNAIPLSFASKDTVRASISAVPLAQYNFLELG